MVQKVCACDPVLVAIRNQIQPAPRKGPSIVVHLNDSEHPPLRPLGRQAPAGLAQNRHGKAFPLESRAPLPV